MIVLVGVHPQSRLTQISCVGIEFHANAFSLDKCRARAFCALRSAVWIWCQMTLLFLSVSFSLDKRRARTCCAFEWAVLIQCSITFMSLDVALSLDKCRAITICACKWSVWIQCPMALMFLYVALSLDNCRARTIGWFQVCICFYVWWTNWWRSHNRHYDILHMTQDS